MASSSYLKTTDSRRVPAPAASREYDGGSCVETSAHRLIQRSHCGADVREGSRADEGRAVSRRTRIHPRICEDWSQKVPHAIFGLSHHRSGVSRQDDGATPVEQTCHCVGLEPVNGSDVAQALPNALNDSLGVSQRSDRCAKRFQRRLSLG